MPHRLACTTAGTTRSADLSMVRRGGGGDGDGSSGDGGACGVATGGLQAPRSSALVPRALRVHRAHATPYETTAS